MREATDHPSETTRRDFLQRSAVAAGGTAAVLGGGWSLAGSDLSDAAAGGSPLVPDPGGLLDLPPGFQYRVLSEEGGRMSNGASVPGSFDGMAALPGERSSTVLVRNHELDSDDDTEVPGRNRYRRDAPGGTTALVVTPDRTLAREYVVSSGTVDNCAGGASPWGTWITCEEELDDEHGYAFEVDPREPESRLSRRPIRAMGHFDHEAVAFDRRTGIVYLTEDNAGGSGDPQDAGPSFLYRYLPNDAAHRADARAKDCAAFVRLEGCDFGRGALWFSDTYGGASQRGQVWRYRPRGRSLEVVHETSDRTQLEQPDNAVLSPWGDLVVCSDSRSRLVGVTPAGDLYPLASSRLAESELCGPTFAPDGRTLFLNAQDPGITYAIWGPFAAVRRPLH